MAKTVSDAKVVKNSKFKIQNSNFFESFRLSRSPTYMEAPPHGPQGGNFTTQTYLLLLRPFHALPNNPQGGNFTTRTCRGGFDSRHSEQLFFRLSRSLKLPQSDALGQPIRHSEHNLLCVRK